MDLPTLALCADNTAATAAACDASMRDAPFSTSASMRCYTAIFKARRTARRRPDASRCSRVILIGATILTSVVKWSMRKPQRYWTARSVPLRSPFFNGIDRPPSLDGVSSSVQSCRWQWILPGPVPNRPRRWANDS